MNRGELLTRLAIWLALGAYALGTAAMLRARGRPWWLAGARWVWTLGCALLITHVLCAFSYYHHWSHAAAYAETARRTGELTGRPWGGGIYFNYLLAGVWLGDVLWWWAAPSSFARRPRWLTSTWHGFLWFMVFNGTVVFGMGPVRWLGGLICTVLAGMWWWASNAASSSGR